MTDSTEVPEAVEGETLQPARRKSPYKRIRKRDSWLRNRHDPTKEEQQEWDEFDMPAHVDIVAGFLASNDFVFGVPDRAEIFRLDALRKKTTRSFSLPDDFGLDDVMSLHYVQPSPIPIVLFTQAHEPIGIGLGDIVEVNYNARITAIVREMFLHNIRVIHGSEHDDSKIVFEGTQLHGPAIRRQIRVVRITVHTPEAATWETLSETNYPRSYF